MQLHLLLTSDIRETRPNSCKILMDFGQLKVVFEKTETKGQHIEEGLHCVVEGEKEDIISWLKPYDRIVVGDGNPMFERFYIKHIKEGIV